MSERESCKFDRLRSSNLERNICVIWTVTYKGVETCNGHTSHKYQASVYSSAREHHIRKTIRLGLASCFWINVLFPYMVLVCTWIFRSLARWHAFQLPFTRLSLSRIFRVNSSTRARLVRPRRLTIPSFHPLPLNKERESRLDVW